MQLGKLAVTARKLHRFLLFFTVPLGLIQVATGMSLKYPAVFGFLDFNTALAVHMTTAGVFAVTFSLMMLTGLYLYLYPYLQRWRHRQPRTPDPQV